MILAQFIRGADEHGIDGADAPADRIRRLELHQHVPDVNADHVGAAQHRQRHERDHKTPGQAEHDRRHAEQGDACEHQRSHAVRDGPPGEGDRDQRSTDARRRAAIEPIGPTFSTSLA
jgi:hypothetical protein